VPASASADELGAEKRRKRSEWERGTCRERENGKKNSRITRIYELFNI
jgi:hypothetical protein